MPPNPFADGLAIQVSGDSSGATSALDNLQGSILTTRKAALGLGGVLAGALAAKGLGAAVEAASSYEDALVEVQKVTDPTTARELGIAMRDLSKEIPVTADELAGLAADAARFGIRGTDNIEKFTETVSKMATATDLSTEQAGEAFARLATLTDTPVDDMENLGSSINELSNNMATSADEIVDSMLRGSAALTSFGLNNTEIVAMSASLNEVSESSERAGTRLRRLAQELMDPRKVEDIARALGMTEREFRNIRRERPDELMMQIVEAMAEGDETAEALRGTLSTTSRQAVAGLAQNLDGLRQSLDLSNKSFKEGESLQREFDAATQTFNSRLQVLKNNLNDVAITVGNQLLPVLNPLVEDVNDLLSGAKDLNATFGEGTASDIKAAATEFRNLRGPVKDNADEVWELAQNLSFLGEDVLPHVAPALRDMRFILEGTAAALGTINDSFEKAGELWNQLPPPVREGLRERLASSANQLKNQPLGGSIPRQSLRNARRGINFARQRGFVDLGPNARARLPGSEEGKVTIVLEERTDVIDSRIESGAENVVFEIERRAGRMGSRSGTGPV